jgi:hypothetical protein
MDKGDGATTRCHVDYDMPELAYHADPCEEPSLSSSMARLLLAGTARQVHHLHPRMGGHPSESTTAQNTGTLIHKLLLGGGPRLEIVDAKDWRKADVRKVRDDALADGALPLLKKEHEYALSVAAEFRTILSGRELDLCDGHNEIVIQYQQEIDGVPIWIRARLDHMHYNSPGLLTIIDLKTTSKAATDDLWRSVERFGYHVQQAAYQEAAETAWPEWAGRVAFYFAFLQIEPVPDVRLGKLDSMMSAIGRLQWAEAKRRWARCMKTGQWPGYGTDIVTLETPDWYGYKYGFET